MIFETKQIILKDGTEATFRSPCLQDAPALLDYLKTTSSETEFVLRYPEECTLTIEQEERFIASINESPFGIMILCEIGGQLAGNCQLSLGSRIKNRHIGRVAIALYQKFWDAVSERQCLKS